jgi:hypothetical protein
MLGFTVSQATVSRYPPGPSRRPTQSWRTFLHNQTIALATISIQRNIPTRSTWACGFFLLRQARAISGADCEVKRGPVSIGVLTKH